MEHSHNDKGIKITQLAWEQILDVMLFYHRSEGYVDEIDGKLQFFDADPRINGIGACHVTIEEVKDYIKSYNNGKR